jgi:hypothetical protein
MKGVLNSELDPTDLVHQYGGGIDKLLEALNQPEYLIALMQRNFYRNFRYDPEGDEWENITPKEYREKIKSLLEKLEDKIWTGSVDVENEMRDWITSRE